MTKVIDQVISDKYAIYNGDSCEVMTDFPDNCFDYSIFSPPFASLYTYSNSDRDLGNSKTHSEFYKHFEFIIKELYRTIKPGRLLSFHCMNLPTSKERDGYIGITDFRGILIKMFQDAGFIYHSEVCIWKDPVVAMQRTKALGLLYKQLKKDSAMSRQGIADYLVTMRKPGINNNPVEHTPEDFPCDEWQQVASPVWREELPDEWKEIDVPVWFDINPSDTLQRLSAREEKDEKHICPLQLEVIRRALKLWSKKGDKVFSPFGGIGSEPYCAVEMDRIGIAVELKQSYYAQMVKNLHQVATERQISLFEAPDSPYNASNVSIDELLTQGQNEAVD